MEPIASWDPPRVAAWMKGLDPALQDYPFETWGLNGKRLLRLSYRDLEALGMSQVGHQELLLEAVEQLCVLNYELSTLNLRILTEKLQGVIRTIQAFIMSHRKVSTYNGDAVDKPTSDLLACVVELIGAAKGLFLWLNRYLFSQLHDYSASRDIIWLCGDLAEIVQKDCTVSEREERILLIGRHIFGICEQILTHSPVNLLNQTAILETVELVPTGPEDSLGIEIKSSPSCLHFISGTAPESPVEHCNRVLPGDEIVQVNGQVVVGWTRMNLVKKLLEVPDRVTLVLKKIPLVFVESSSSPGSPPHQQALDSFLDALEPTRLGSDESPTSSASPSSSVMAELEQGPDSALDLPTNEEEEQQGIGSRNSEGNIHGFMGHISGADSPPGASSDLAQEEQSFQSVSEGHTTPETASPNKPRTLELGLQSPPSPEHGFVRGNRGLGATDPAKEASRGSIEYRRKQKGMATRLSRRRISCQELGQVDCDGWLLKKKDHVGFMAQKWKRFWFVLKGQTLYWYNNPNDEKAVGLINVSAYRLESTKEQKKKYVFQFTHEKYKPFIFAAETLADLSMWVSRLITSMMKYTPTHKSVPPQQEDCYSETEAEDPEDDSPRHSLERPKRRELEKDRLPTGATGSSESPCKSPLDSPVLWQKEETHIVPSSPTDPAGEELESLIRCLKQGGVSLIGKQQVFTREYYRKSFVKRNKNPEINEKVHHVRTLQSTLKAKTAELQLLDILLDDSELTSEKFRHWKEQHQELYQEIQAWWAKKVSQENGARTDSVSDIHPEDAVAAAAAAP
ncbi:connector enhancer of kinase suppressor of ras 1 isoform X2 [Sceloporus undulatus]|uniref:connector enhancer of kinase suppressor of ras 1 isoform X2 n=1 Tax=Sceloporus undulatus TaxID=8520 RepID=UPI001C4C9A76|nr:connector enhancer of kinase suppressor of ras 1 isoform X2 [Sceloporus undulatus]